MKALLLIAHHLIVLHGPGGQIIDINPEQVVSVREPRSDEGHLQKGIHCLVNTSDGKFSAVVEDCDTVRVLIEDGKEKK